MNETQGERIVFLLAAILCVMLFEAGAVLTGLGWVAGVGAVLAVIFLIVAGISWCFVSLLDAVAAARTQRQPWLWMLVFLSGFIGDLIVLGFAGLRWMGGGISYKDALRTTPYWWVPVSIMFAAMAVAAIESAHEWLPKLHEWVLKVPGRIAAFLRALPGRIAALLRGWLMILGGPVLGPVRRWQAIRERRARGERVGAISAGLSLLAIFAESVLLWLGFVLIPVVIVTVVVAASFR
jgi:hypothetical protein